MRLYIDLHQICKFTIFRFCCSVRVGLMCRPVVDGIVAIAYLSCLPTRLLLMVRWSSPCPSLQERRLLEHRKLHKFRKRISTCSHRSMGKFGKLETSLLSVGQSFRIPGDKMMKFVLRRVAADHYDSIWCWSRGHTRSWFDSPFDGDFCWQEGESESGYMSLGHSAFRIWSQQLFWSTK